MASRLSNEDIQQLAPLLGSLARLVTRGSRLSENELKILLLGTDVSYTPVVFQELLLWEQLLRTLYEQPLAEMRSVTVETLLMRGLPEANVLLSIDVVTKGGSPSQGAQQAPQVSHSQRLRIQPASLDFGTLQEGYSSAQELEIQGGPGRIIVESEQVLVSPLQFGSGMTRVRVSVKPLYDSLLWTSLKFITRAESMEVPVLAQWDSTAVTFAAPAALITHSSPVQPVQPIRSTQAQNTDIAAMINDEFNASSGSGSSPNRNTQPQKPSRGDEDILDQIQRLI